MLSLGGLVSSSHLGELDPKIILRDRLRIWYHANYSETIGAGTWTDEIVGQVANKITDRFPSTVTTPAGNLALQFDYTPPNDPTNDFLNWDTIPNGFTMLPSTFSGYYICFFGFRLDTSTGDDDKYNLFTESTGGVNSIGFNDPALASDNSKLYVYGAKSNSGLFDSTWHTAVAVCQALSPTTATVKLWVDGTLQSTTGTAQMGRFWGGDSFTFSADQFGGFDGKLCSIGFGHAYQAFTDQEVDKLHQFLNFYIFGGNY